MPEFLLWGSNRKFYSCPAEDILLYPNSNMENKTRKKEKKNYFHTSSRAMVVSRSLIFLEICAGSCRHGLSGPAMLMVPPHHLCWLGLHLQQIQPSSLKVQCVVEKRP